VTGEPGKVTAQVIAAANVDFAVPGAYTIGERFPTWEEAAAHARSKIQRFEYPGQAVNENSDDYHPRRHFKEGGTLVVCSRVFVDIRITGPAGDYPLSRWEIFRDGPAETTAHARLPDGW
jgi:hypothetical protein